MDYRVSTLATIGAITPFVGLFGTVWGIIDAFSGLSTGGGSIEAVAPGIAEALVATAVGLAAAIPAVWFYNHFNNQITRINSQMESFSQEFLNLIERSILIKKD
jgi:biopolymer transport protein TolQ